MVTQQTGQCGKVCETRLQLGFPLSLPMNLCLYSLTELLKNWVCVPQHNTDEDKSPPFC